MKACIICGIEQELTEFYPHKQMKDGHLNKCKTCCKKQADEREKELRKNPEWVEMEKARSREKFHRLYKDGRHKPTREEKREIMKKYKQKYPEKQSAKNATQHLERTLELPELHHWSYNEEHWKDVIPLTVKDHNLLHRHIIYDQDIKMYRNSKGEVLGTKQSHIDLLEFLKQTDKKYIPKKFLKV